jgi:putative phosphoesterase
MDNGAWAQALPEVKLVEFGNVRVYVFHDVYQLEIKPNTAGIHVIVSGHTYYPAIEKKNGVLFVNPGSASQPRFN